MRCNALGAGYTAALICGNLRFSRIDKYTGKSMTINNRNILD